MFYECSDQKVLPLPPMRAAPGEWFSRSPDRCSGVGIPLKTATQHSTGQNPPSSPNRLFGGRYQPCFVKQSSQSHPLSRIFLDAVERGDKSTVARCLKCPQPVNVNCTNMLGRTAIQIAVDNENFEIVELLLKEPNIRIGDALLYAVQEGVYRIVEMLIDHHSITKEMLGTSWSKRISLSEESHDFSADISPVILASICNQFEILQLLLSRGALIDRPHRSTCRCNECTIMTKEDSLKYSLWRMNTYRALASPAWISLTSPDPVLAAFKLSWELCHLASRENEFKEVFLQLSDQCKRYACDLLDQCRSTEEVLAVLSRSSDDFDEHVEGDCDGGGRAGEGPEEKPLKPAFRRTTTVVHRVPPTGWRGGGHSQATHVEALIEMSNMKRLESQYTIVEDLANIEAFHPPREHGGLNRIKGDRAGGAALQGVEIFDNEDGAGVEEEEEPGRREHYDEHVDHHSAAYAETTEEEEEDDGEDGEVALMQLDRLKLAIKYEQKRVSVSI